METALAATSSLQQIDETQVVSRVVVTVLILCAGTILAANAGQSGHSLLSSAAMMFRHPSGGPELDQIKLLVEENKAQKWRSLTEFMVGTPAAVLQPLFYLVMGHPLLEDGAVRQVMLVGDAVAASFLVIFLLAHFRSWEWKGAPCAFTYVWIYAAMAIIPAFATTSGTYALALGARTMVHSWTVPLCPSRQCLMWLQGLHLPFKLWTIFRAPFLEDSLHYILAGLSVLDGVMGVVFFSVSENGMLEFALQVLQARQAEVAALKDGQAKVTAAKDMAYGLLSSLADVVVALGSDLAILEDSPRLASLLFRKAVQAGTPFRQLVSPDEVKRVTQFLQEESQKTRQLITELLDVSGKKVKVRIYLFQEIVGEVRQHLLGLVEESSVQEAIAPLRSRSETKKGAEPPLRPAKGASPLGRALEERVEEDAAFPGSPTSSRSTSSISSWRALDRLLPCTLEEIQGEWHGCECGVVETLVISGSTAISTLSAKIEVQAASLTFMAQGKGTLQVLPPKGRALTYQGPLSTSTDLFAALQGPWSPAAAWTPSLQIQSDMMTLKRTLPLSPGADGKLQMQSQRLSLRRGCLLWHDALRGTQLCYRRALQPDVAVHWM